MNYNPGDRIGAILGKKDGVIELLGYGTFTGHAVPVEAVGAFAEMLKEWERKNPRLQLDNGKIVYGCECWWGSEAAIMSELVRQQEIGFIVVEVDIDEVRAKYQAREVIQ